MYEETLRKLAEARKELEKVAKELNFDIFCILGNNRVSLNDSFPDFLDIKSKELSPDDILRLFKAFFNFQSLTLTCMDMIIMNNLGEQIKKTTEKKKKIEDKIWKSYFQKLMGNDNDD